MVYAVVVEMKLKYILVLVVLLLIQVSLSSVNIRALKSTYRQIRSYGTIVSFSDGMDLKPLGMGLWTRTVPNSDFEKDCDLAKDLGIHWARTEFLWDLIEPEKGNFNWELADYIVNTILKRSGTDKVLVLVTNTPEWATSHKYPERYWTYPPDDLSDIVDFATAIVNRYKDRIKHWEIWCEPNLDEYWSGTDEGFFAVYRTYYNAIKKADPNAIVMNGGISNADYEYLRLMYESGLKSYFDIFAIHPYCEGSPLEEGPTKDYYPNVARCLDVMAEYGDGEKDVWITEIGWNTDPNPPHNAATEDEQAEWLQQAFYYAKDNWSQVKKFIWFIIQDYDGAKYGFVRLDGSKKPSWYTYGELVKLYS